MLIASLCVTRKPNCGPGVGHQVCTRVMAPGRSIQIAAWHYSSQRSNLFDDFANRVVENPGNGLGFSHRHRDRIDRETGEDRLGDPLAERLDEAVLAVGRDVLDGLVDRLVVDGLETC